MTPYFTQHRPPALVAALPPMEQISKDDGIRRIPESVLLDRGLHLGVEQPGLADRGPGHRVDGDVAHLLGGQHDALGQCRGATGQPGACAAGDHRDLMFGAPPDSGLDVGGAGRPDHGERGPGVGISGPVLPVGRHDVGVGDDHAIRQRRHQVCHHSCCRHDRSVIRQTRQPETKRSGARPFRWRRSGAELDLSGTDDLGDALGPFFGLHLCGNLR